ncbi:ribonuclease H [Trifolium pratense]|uniref:Ribonuclease H n=1 Tax=Trifolium pratense TaxID=57577 RepID=A0A2K3KY41_TRIPR|nr:ribonuclease H [Trifolium pratense]
MLHSCSVAFDNHLQETAQVSSQNLVAWSRPSEGNVCLNVDGSLLGSPQSADFGGLIRNNDETFLGGFLWNVICFSDSLHTVALVKSVSSYHQFANEIISIRQLLDRDWNVVVDHTLREGNACADNLAKMGAISVCPLVKFEVLPAELSSLLLADAMGVAFVRG